jgi:uncharacterized membrane protein
LPSFYTGVEAGRLVKIEDDPVHLTWKVLSGRVGLGSTGTYLLILTAFRQAPASYVVASRELSIAVAVGLGVAVLKEPLTVPKVLSTAAILVGVVLVKVA